MSSSFDNFVKIVATLRGENGCPWDKEQTLYSMKEKLIEEAYETVEALDNKDIPNIREEFGDLLLHIVLHSQIAYEEGLFDINDVISGISDKIVRRHPHVFAGSVANSANEVLLKWEEIKKAEKAGDNTTKSILYKVGNGQPPLVRAQKIQEKVAKIGFDWKSPQEVLDKLDEEVRELRHACNVKDMGNIKEEIGDLLFVIINLARHYNISADESLRLSNDKFTKRFQYIERQLHKLDRSVDSAPLEEMETYWQQAKKEIG